MLHNTQFFMNFHILVRSANETVVLYQLMRLEYVHA